MCIKLILNFHNIVFHTISHCSCFVNKRFIRGGSRSGCKVLLTGFINVLTVLTIISISVRTGILVICPIYYQSIRYSKTKYLHLKTNVSFVGQARWCTGLLQHVVIRQQSKAFKVQRYAGYIVVQEIQENKKKACCFEIWQSCGWGLF